MRKLPPPYVVVLGLGLGVAPSCAQEPPGAAPAPAAAAPSAAFLRFVDLGSYRGRLEVAIARFTDAAGKVEVDLVSAVHVGDAAYYADLRRRFAGYDAVLYELVAPAGSVPDRNVKETGFNPVSALQRGMQRALQLEFQLDAIDYEQDNFVHADLSPREIARLWRERGESLLSTLLQMMVGAARVQAERYEAEAERAAEQAPDASDVPPKPRSRQERQRALKWSLARELGPMEEMLAMFGKDKGSGSVLIGARNARAIEVLEREMKADKKKLAIFYGAAHMPDLAARLRALGLHRRSDEWVVAWSVDAPAPATIPPPEGRGR